MWCATRVGGVLGTDVGMHDGTEAPACGAPPANEACIEQPVGGVECATHSLCEHTQTRRDAAKEKYHRLFTNIVNG